MIPTIILVFPLVMIYVWLIFLNKRTKSKEETRKPSERCAYCDIANSIH